MTGPRPARGKMPFPGHRTMAAVMADEERELALTLSCTLCGAGVGQACISTRGTETSHPHCQQAWPGARYDRRSGACSRRPQETARNSAIKAAWMTGAKASDIAQRFRISRQRVGAILRRSGVQVRRGRPVELPPMTEEQSAHYRKLRRYLGAKVAREEMFKGIGSDQLLSDPRYADQAWERVFQDDREERSDSEH